MAFVLVLLSGTLAVSLPATSAASDGRAWEKAPVVDAESDMLVLPYAASGIWLAGDAHVHSVRHDQPGIPSSSAAAKTAEAMKAAGLDFTVLTDHDTVTKLPEVDGFILISGIEVTSKRGTGRAHVVGIGATQPVAWPDMTDQEVLAAVEAQGAMAVLAHANARSEWATGTSWSADAIATLSNYTGIEIYNHMVEVKQRAAGTGWALDAWFVALSTGRQVWGLSVSDLHGPGPFGHGFLVVQAASADPDAIREALAAGRFVSVVSPVAVSPSVWPSRIATVDDALIVESASTHPAVAIVFYDATGRVRHSAPAASATYVVTGDEGFVVAELQGIDGSRVFLQPARVVSEAGRAPWETGQAVRVPQVGPAAPEVGPVEKVPGLGVFLVGGLVVAVAAWPRGRR